MATKYRTIPDLTPQEIKRFWSKVDKTPGHGPQGKYWPWTGAIAKGKLPYGKACIGHTISTGAHRIALILSSGKQLQLCALHTCDNPPCCNPAHLYWGTHLQNAKDRGDRGRHINPMAGKPNPYKGKTVNNANRPRGKRWHEIFDQFSVCGESHPNAKFTADEVRSIRAKYALGGTSYRLLAAEYNRPRVMIGKIIKRQIWKHV